MVALLDRGGIAPRARAARRSGAVTGSPQATRRVAQRRFGREQRSALTAPTGVQTSASRGQDRPLLFHSPSGAWISILIGSWSRRSGSGDSAGAPLAPMSPGQLTERVRDLFAIGARGRHLRHEPIHLLRRGRGSSLRERGARSRRATRARLSSRLEESSPCRARARSAPAAAPRPPPRHGHGSDGRRPAPRRDRSHRALVFAGLPRTARSVALAATPRARRCRANSRLHSRSVALRMLRRFPCSLTALTTMWTCGCGSSVWSTMA